MEALKNLVKINQYIHARLDMYGQRSQQEVISITMWCYL